jgi:hypothetical protein
MSTRDSLSAFALVCAMALPTAAHAQEGEGAVKAFQAASDETLQDQRHRHLWIAYAALWAIAFGFVWRTSARQAAAESALSALNARLDAWERDRA